MKNTSKKQNKIWDLLEDSDNSLKFRKKGSLCSPRTPRPNTYKAKRSLNYTPNTKITEKDLMGNSTRSLMTD